MEIISKKFSGGYLFLHQSSKEDLALKIVARGEEVTLLLTEQAEQEGLVNQLEAEVARLQVELAAAEETVEVQRTEFRDTYQEDFEVYRKQRDAALD